MKGRTSITINGRIYDAITGMPINQAASVSSPQKITPPSGHMPKQTATHAKPETQPSQTHRAFTDIAMPRTNAAPFKKAIASTRSDAPKAPAAVVHQRPQKSQTLYRAALKRPHPPVTTPVTPTRSPAISKFANNEDSTPSVHATPSVQKVKPQPITQAQVHPAVAKALQAMQAPEATPTKPEEPRSSKELKELLIKEGLAEVESKNKSKQKRKSFFAKRPRFATILTSSLATLLLGGYLTYINLPSISMHVAATNAGISANFPNYKPDGYSFEGPITYAAGEVSVKFNSNTNNSNFILKQQGSNWDSQAVLDNFVNKQTDNYLTYQEKGLTIYSFDNKAAWVNGGILYTIEGDAQLSSEQLLRIATSI